MAESLLAVCVLLCLQLHSVCSIECCCTDLNCHFASATAVMHYYGPISHRVRQVLEH